MQLMRWFLAMLAIGGLNAADVTISHSWARATAPSASNGAIFATIANVSTSADELTSASVAATIADHAELHAHTKGADGVTRMAPVTAIAVPAGGSAVLKPGGFHIMLLGLKKPLIEGQQIALTLTFTHAGIVPVQTVVGGISATEWPSDADESCCKPDAK